MRQLLKDLNEKLEKYAKYDIEQIESMMKISTMKEEKINGLIKKLEHVLVKK
jgi:hypothetical protein